MMRGFYRVAWGQVVAGALCLGVASAADAKTDAWIVDGAHSSVGFEIAHLGFFPVEGAFDSFEGTIHFNPAKMDDVNAFKVTASADVASIDTGNSKRDNHLRSDDFFSADKFKKIRFVSTKVEAMGPKRFKVTGNLTIRDTTKPVAFEVTYTGETTQDGKRRVGFLAKTNIDRYDYGLKWNKVAEAGGFMVGREVAIELKVAAVHNSAPAE